ncbi:NYN domain-containing protein [Pseudoalteromonas sp. 68 DY56-GL68]|uniref:NYN domain-containing protein n=1 Tax=Pseudoalteromonas sp. 68 DY56-GL68 TaxID=2974919 RepID=UPI00352A7C90
MRTRVYIDGYNFYYGCLKNTPYKWLDLAHLFEKHLLPRSGITSSILHPNFGIKFYTAEISEKVAEDGSSVDDQRSYHAALKNHRSNSVKVKVVKGSYVIDEVDSRLVEHNEKGQKKEPRDCSKVKVWKIEEKQSDVNVALDAVFDAFSDPEVEHIVFTTNDTDIAPALNKLKELNALNLRTPIKIGLVIPSKERTGPRRANKTLSQLADWTIDYILDDELANSQLPARIRGGNKAVFRPLSWFEYHQEVAEIIEILSAEGVCDTVPKAWRWLTDSKPDVPGLPILEDDPSSMLLSQEGVRAVLAHAKAFSEFKRGQ